MHKNGQPCDSCIKKLEGCHIGIGTFFVWVRSRFPEAHISWGFRNQQQQDLAFNTGQSKTKWPDSKHNNMADGVPASMAIDIFRLGPDGKAYFEVEFYEKIWTASQLEGFNGIVEWGGNFKTLKDYNHFELGG